MPPQVSFQRFAIQAPKPEVVQWAPQTGGQGFAISGDLNGVPMAFARNAEIYGEGESAEFLYQVVSGAVRTCKVLADGRRQIASFHLPGDMFGLETGEQHAFSAEAIVASKVIVVKRTRVAELATRNADVSRELFAAVGRELRRVQDHILLLIKTAQERVAGFLLEMATRNGSKDEFDLPMSRQDIADYLGLTIETVSRTMTGLEQSNLIELPCARSVVLRNRAALARLGR